MFRISLCLLVFLSVSCTHSTPSPEVKTFVQSWKDQYEPHSENYAQVYQRYLASVEKVYKKNDQHEKFRSYLDSLNNNSQILADQEASILDLYRNSIRRTTASKDDSDFKLFRTRRMSELSDKLYQGRELKIKEEVGDSMYSDLHNNYNQFVSKTNAEKFAFPL